MEAGSLPSEAVKLALPALSVSGRPSPVDQCERANVTDNSRVVVPLDDVKHHVEGRGPTGTGEDVAVDMVDTRTKAHAAELLGESRHVLPVNDAFLVIEQTGIRQNVSPGAHPCQRDTAVSAFAQPRLGCTAEIAALVVDIDELKGVPRSLVRTVMGDAA